MVKIVDGVVQRDIEAGSSTDSTGGATTNNTNTLRLCGTDVSYTYLGVFLLITFLINGLGGVLVCGMIIGGLYFYEKNQSTASATSSTSGSGAGGWFSMPTRASGTSGSTSTSASSGGKCCGANIKGMGDLPKPARRYVPFSLSLSLSLSLSVTLILTLTPTLTLTLSIVREDQAGVRVYLALVYCH